MSQAKNRLDNTRSNRYYQSMSTVEGKPTSARRFDSPEQEAFLNLWRTYDRLRALEDELFARHELTAQQYNALRLLRGGYPGTLPTLVLAARLVSRRRISLAWWIAWNSAGSWAANG